MGALIETPHQAVAEYQAVNHRAGWVDRSHRVRLTISGPDRAKFLHNLTTNDVKRLANNAGQESFVTSPQGKTLAYVTLIAGEDSVILLRTELASLELLLPHLNKYGIFDDVAIADVSSETFEYHLAGPEAGLILERAGMTLPAEVELAHRLDMLGGLAGVRLIRESLTGRPGFTLFGSLPMARVVKALFEMQNVPELTQDTFNSLRIEAGSPLSGLDVSTNHLPQEVGRDARSINFVKGCYLGQETVARLDALGHVNRIFRGLRLERAATGVIPAAGTVLMFEGKAVGSITSAAYSPGWEAPIALGFVKVAQATAGSRLVANVEGSGEVVAIVHDLPMIPLTSQTTEKLGT